MNRIRYLSFLAVAMIAITVVPSVVSAELVVPPGNSAVNQYTETFPTTGGNATTGGEQRSPDDVLGNRKTQRLEGFGADGRAAAAAAAQTAPQGAGARIRAASRAAAAGDEPSGSSGLAEVIGYATGSSPSGGVGFLLPLVIAGAIIWSAAFFWQRRQTA